MNSIFKKISFLIIFVCLAGAFWSCKQENHFLKDENYRTKVHEQFLKRKGEYKNVPLFNNIDSLNLTLEEKEALEFLYAYMPLSDLADYDEDYFINQVKGAFKARDTFEWGNKIPEHLFRHFVLVYRVNNENLDNARDVFFEELKDRVQGMSMEDAVLEVNHWCHEKITYRGTDSRTSAPLALMKTSWGRCGEQSTFTVMALRSIGIPARQCYTPRWVHTDDNHAWVEAWVDGKWRYMGASEPEAKLDVAWFDKPVKRAMMVHTNVFGEYDGPEDKTKQEDLYSIINVLDTYAETREVEVMVVDEQSNPVTGADVKFEVYNYAEYYPIATLQTNKEGKVKLKTNKEGDLLVWASKDKTFGYKKVEAKDLENTIMLGSELPTKDETLVMHVPSEKPIQELSQEEIAKNSIRLAHEDSIRNAYMSTFISEEKAKTLAKANNLNEELVWKLLNLSQGNWQDISLFIVDHKEDSKTLDFLQTLTEKELRDTPKEYLDNHFLNAENVGIKEGVPNSLLIPYIYSPHISNELIRPWRKDLQEIFTKEEIEKFQDNPALLTDFVKQNIKISNAENYYQSPVSPVGVFRMQLADNHSRNIFFIALARALGIPARLDASNGRPQYYDEEWKDVIFGAPDQVIPKSSIRFTNNPNNIIKPGYYYHFTVGKFNGNDYSTIYFDENGMGALPVTSPVDAGMYRLVVGSRANDGSVTVGLKYFEAPADKTVNQEITLPIPENLLQVQGIVDPNTIVELDNGKKSLKQLMNGKGLMLVFADPDREPTKHILQDLPQVADALNQWGGSVLFLVPDDKLSKAFDSASFSGLPNNTVWGVDANRTLLNGVANTLQMSFTNNFPLVIYLNTNGGILYSHAGYTIGIGENIIKTIEQEKQTMAK